MNPLDVLLWILAISVGWIVGSIAIGVTWSVIRTVQKKGQKDD
jgi:hypothetical protein